MQNPDPRYRQSVGKFITLKDGEQWESRTLPNAMTRAEKVECLEGTRKIEIRHSISRVDFQRVEDSIGSTNKQKEMEKQIEVSLLQKEQVQPR